MKTRLVPSPFFFLITLFFLFMEKQISFATPFLGPENEARLNQVMSENIAEGQHESKVIAPIQGGPTTIRNENESGKNNSAKNIEVKLENLPALTAMITTPFAGNFEIKSNAKEANESACQKKIEDLKTVVEQNLKRAVYKVECSESLFSRNDSLRGEYSSTATVTFY